MVSDDWETRQCVDGFLDLAEGSIADVISLAKEKWWLRRNTRLGDMLQQALAAARLARGGGAVGYGRDGDYGSLDVAEEEEEEEEDDEDDPELMQLTEESGVRDLALGDWARARILDGYWFSPADIWYQYSVPGQPAVVPAIHPCPWTRERSLSNASSGSALSTTDEVEVVEEEHPKRSTFTAEIPPSYSLCEQAYVAHQRQMRVVLLPVLKNVVRRLVMECAASEGRREDPAVRAARMSMEEVLRIVREEEGVWFDGVDWAERRRSDDAVKRRKRVQRAREDAALLKRSRREDDSGSSSSGSSSIKSSSSGTSPVLSATTLQTTPSPPPLSDEGVVGVEVEKKEDEVRPMTIPVSPVLNPPRLLRPIPYVPVTTMNMPHYSLEAFRAVSFYIFLSSFFVINMGFFVRSGEKLALHCITADVGSANEQLYWPMLRRLGIPTSLLQLFHLSKSSSQRRVPLLILRYSEVGIKGTRWRSRLMKLLRLSLI